MTTVYHEILPESYLLLLMPEATSNPELALEYGLRCASRSGKAAVWVDCELVHALSAEAVQSLCDYYYQLQEQHMKLVLVHACDELKEELSHCKVGSDLCFAPTLFDAAWHTGLRLVA